MAPGEAWTHHGCGEFSGVNGTSLLREAEFTHAPSQGGKDGWKWAERQESYAESAERLVGSDLKNGGNGLISSVSNRLTV